MGPIMETICVSDGLVYIATQEVKELMCVHKHIDKLVNSRIFIIDMQARRLVKHCEWFLRCLTRCGAEVGLREMILEIIEEWKYGWVEVGVEKGELKKWNRVFKDWWNVVREVETIIGWR